MKTIKYLLSKNLAALAIFSFLFMPVAGAQTKKTTPAPTNESNGKGKCEKDVKDKSKQKAADARTTNCSKNGRKEKNAKEKAEGMKKSLSGAGNF